MTALLLIGALGGPVLAEPMELAPGSFDLASPNAAMAVVTRYEVPVLPLDAGPLRCPLTLRVRESNEVEWLMEQCPPALRPPVQQALDQWRVTWSGKPGLTALVHLEVRVMQGPGDAGPATWITLPPEAVTQGLTMVRPEGVLVVRDPELTRKVEPRSPRGLHTATACPLVLSLDDKGRVAQVAAEGCPEVVRESAVTAASRWRFEPLQIEGRALPSTYAVELTFWP